jgi:hypothetical protein
MRIPLVAELDSRDGSSDKDSRFTNTIAELEEGVAMVVVRPGLSTSATLSGNGNGLVSFNDQLIKIYGNTVYVPGGSFALPAGTFTPA